jgi:hypothetical protein
MHQQASLSFLVEISKYSMGGWLFGHAKSHCRLHGIPFKAGGNCFRRGLNPKPKHSKGFVLDSEKICRYSNFIADLLPLH